MIVTTPGWGTAFTLSRAYLADSSTGATVLTILGGHSIDALCFCLGEFREVSSVVATQRQRGKTAPRACGGCWRPTLRDPRQRRRTRQRRCYRPGGFWGWRCWRAIRDSGGTSAKSPYCAGVRAHFSTATRSFAIPFVSNTLMYFIMLEIKARSRLPPRGCDGAHGDQ